VSEPPQIPAGVREGDVLAGKYRIDKILGVGGMGVVVAAHHIQLDDRVAIKFMLPSGLSNREAVSRFAREARAAVKIKGEHVARVSDVGTLENGAPYMVMEYLDGIDLADWLKQRGPLPVEQAVEFLLQACEAIAEAHALGIVHRDLKPANLFVVSGPDRGLMVKVLDFGISKSTSLTPVGSDMTQSSVVMGSPLYMSPEQMRSAKDTDSRSDIWALGVILYELIAGRTPFKGDSMANLVCDVMSGAPFPLREARPDAPEGIEAVIMRCLDKDRGARYETIGELAIALMPFGSKRSRSSVERISRVLGAAGLSASALALPPSSDKEKTVESATTEIGASSGASWGKTIRSNRRAPWIIFGGVAVLIAGVGGFMVMNKSAATGTETLGSSAASRATAIAEPVPPTSSKATAVESPSPPVPPSATVPTSPINEGVTSSSGGKAKKNGPSKVVATPKGATSPPVAPVGASGPATKASQNTAAAPAKTGTMFDDRK
jgi:serine/threonine-protein kinase